MMARELLIELGCEELPASWLPPLTAQIGEHLAARLADVRLVPEAPIETFSTPRRLTARVAKLAERQTDLEEVITGPAVGSAFGPDGQPTPAALGFARKHGVDVSALDRTTTAKGTYLVVRKQQPGQPALGVLPGVMASLLRSLSFPKQMHWDATLDDGRGELLFGRPIRWILFLYGPKVVPFTISRLSAGQTAHVQAIRSGAATYGHRFLATSGRAGRAVRVRSFEQYRARLLENFVVLDRGERHDRIARGLDEHAARLGGRVSRDAAGQSKLLEEVPDLVEYPSVIAGTFAPGFLALPEEVLTTTMIHHQHYFPLVNESGQLLPAFLAVTNTQADDDDVIAHNSERVLTARLRDAQFFWEADRKVPLASRVDDLETVLFHKALGSYKAKAERIERLAAWIAVNAFGQAPEAAGQAARAARLAKADLTTDMVRELTELQGTMGGIYAREEGMPEAIWKAIYYQYLPASVEAEAPPTAQMLGAAAVTWAAVSLADKLDTVVGLFAAGEKPTGSRDPYGVRRAAQGVVKILADVSQLGLSGDQSRRVDLTQLIHEAFAPFVPSGGSRDGWRTLGFGDFFFERQAHLLGQRGFGILETRAVRKFWASPASVKERVEALSVPEVRASADFYALAELFKRAKNITRDFDRTEGLETLRERLREPAEIALIDALIERSPVISDALRRADYVAAVRELAPLREPVHQFFTDVMVMVEDRDLRDTRLTLLATLREAVYQIADLSQLVAEEPKI